MTDPRQALDAIGTLPDSEIDIADAALQLARVDAPGADWLAARAHLSALARESAALAADDPTTRASALSELLADRHGYRGDAQTYDDPANANLIAVIARRRGLPVTLSILWLHCARSAGWHAEGLNFPGHFLIVLQGPQCSVVVDAFAGGVVLDTATIEAMMQRAGARSSISNLGWIQPVDARSILIRLQNNIWTRRMNAGDHRGALACVIDTLRIAPRSPALSQIAAELRVRLATEMKPGPRPRPPARPA